LLIEYKEGDFYDATELLRTAISRRVPDYPITYFYGAKETIEQIHRLLTS
jgi:hypothetical protein